jgi:hypothetical protein
LITSHDHPHRRAIHSYAGQRLDEVRVGDMVGAMARSPRRPPLLRGKVFQGSAVRAAGLLTETDLRSSAWRRLYRDVYAASFGCWHIPIPGRSR